jgi:hypothetical protein
MDSSWWDRPAYETFPRRRWSLLSDHEYDYDEPADALQHVPCLQPPPQHEEEEEEVLMEEEAIQMVIQDSELIESQWEGVGM